jgi:CRP-like cAMP-binding protein
VKNYFRKKSGYDEREVLDKLPLILRTQMMDHIYKAPIKEIPLFSGLDSLILDDLCLQIRPLTCIKGDYIYSAGEVARELYVIIKGRVAICSPRPKDPAISLSSDYGHKSTEPHKPSTLKGRVRTGFNEFFHGEKSDRSRMTNVLESGSFFGEREVVLERQHNKSVLASKPSQQTELVQRTEDALALKNCELGFLVWAHISDLSKDYPELIERIEQVAELRRQHHRERAAAKISSPRQQPNTARHDPVSQMRPPSKPELLPQSEPKPKLKPLSELEPAPEPEPEPEAEPEPEPEPKLESKPEPAPACTRSRTFDAHQKIDDVHQESP